ncbi:MAG: 30S ribosomal protein S8 [Phycisphaeraceae bacterium]|nr:30S ribosomal protein S8 [Phycisphaeraceae bacterium]MCW5754338.1 30S ribosomal protein S8 [Phycisphaeraceae bacterium]
MSLSDPIADMLTRIRNAGRTRKRTVTVLNSKVNRGIADVLKREGYVNDFDVIEDGRQGLIRLNLKYGPRGETVLHRIDRVSKPGRRVYSGVDDLERPLQGLGILVVSTSKGVLSDRMCREQRLGGEVLALVE